MWQHEEGTVVGSSLDNYYPLEEFSREKGKCTQEELDLGSYFNDKEIKGHERKVCGQVCMNVKVGHD